ncbi:MAG: helix-turn-helix transcriptional regulator [Heyndrickxia faecalis]|jgi:putative transcriptional regulator|uniref:Transcriptional regulator, XRE family n=3 Tax=Heyndrickxia TaxID=2837504 RepID=G2TR68_HEYCO|nr:MULTISPECIES: helix-turn-helix transcriptional regulator [Heyndrickxia]AEP00144.1 transcriptional regulator, XRE family [Heyndrickxia coagulans 36D1]APB38161.1 transcriptional regulator [Heyndrickxia coagulans]AVD55022.1 transcriptional regulator [Heyndrickxia coagulans]AWP35901.1 transcriptional regulator [Heyndrickxia coagulans]KGT39021.1 Cro/Cl family transcriptional regulator [Heyndrickxia coagulans P38]
MVKNNIKLLRKEIGITQEQLAKELKITRQTVITIENHRYNPSLELALKIAKFFGKNVEEIFFLEEGEDSAV